MPEEARARILATLRAASQHPVAGLQSEFGVLERKGYPETERYPRLRRMMEAVKAEFLETTDTEWPSAVHAFLREQGLGSLLYGPSTAAGRRLADFWPAGQLRLVAYDQPVEAIKGSLFREVAAGFTTTRGGIAETGGLIVWPGPDEPRLLSLVPPVHIALLHIDEIYDTFWHAMREQGWAAGMPPNALLISGPSKTADIEQTLAYGVHGPKRLVVVAVRRDL